MAEDDDTETEDGQQHQAVPGDTPATGPPPEGAETAQDTEIVEDAEIVEEPDAESNTRQASELKAVFDVPVHISAVLGRTNMEVNELLKLKDGDILELDRKVGEAIDIYVNNRLVARGEVVVVEDKLGVTMTEIIKVDRT